MRNFLERMGWKLVQFMQGRNGMDTLAQYALGAGLILTVLDFFFASAILSVLGFAALAYALYRCYSKNIAARALENARFESWVRGPKAKLAQGRARMEKRSTTKYFKCSQCGQRLSVPKGKGKLRVTCPKCGHGDTVDS